MERNKKVLLYSGGMDSWLIDKLWEPDIKLYVNMHTTYSKQEISHLPDNVTVVDFPLGVWERDDKIIPLRNLYIVMVACNITETEDIEICLGATAGDRVLDKSKEFVNKVNDLLNYLYSPQWWIPNGRKVKLNIDYKDYSKEQLLALYIKKGGSLDKAFKESFSCYNPVKNKVCWSCKPCFRKFVAFEKLGYKFSEDTLRLVIPYIQHNIIPYIKAGTYGRGQAEESAIMEAVCKYERYCD